MDELIFNSSKVTKSDITITKKTTVLTLQMFIYFVLIKKLHKHTLAFIENFA